MRWVLRGGVLGVVLVAAACNERRAPPPPVDGSLVLELGGPQGSLREALSAHGVTIGPGHHLRDLPVEPLDATARTPQDGPSPSHPDDPQPRTEPAPVDPPPPTPAPAEFKVVQLRRGQTLIHLAKEQLGDGNRFRELLTLNGWTEADARRLAEGTSVRVPRTGKTPPKSKR